MTIYTKCILHPKEESDGLRISIMSRHTLSDGVTPDDRITKDLYEKHMPFLAPSPRLLGDYYKRGLSWEDYEKRYIEELKDKHFALETITRIALDENVTFLCIEDTPEHCHRRLLAEACQSLQPQLKVICK